MAKRKPKTTKYQRMRVAAGHPFPSHLGHNTPEEWRNYKRTQWREVMASLHRFHYGSAYVPSGSQTLYQLTKMAEQMSELMEAEGWICW